MSDASNIFSSSPLMAPTAAGVRIPVASDPTGSDGARRGLALFETATAAPLLRRRFSPRQNSLPYLDLWSAAFACGDAQRAWPIQYSAPNPIEFPPYPEDCRMASAAPTIGGAWTSWADAGRGVGQPGSQGGRGIIGCRWATDGETPAPLVSALRPILQHHAGGPYEWTGETYPELGEFGPRAQATATAEWVFLYEEYEYDEDLEEDVYIGDRYEFVLSQLTNGGGYNPASPPLVTFTGADDVVAVASVSGLLNGASVDIIDAPDLIVAPGDPPPVVTVSIAAPPAAGDHTDSPPSGVAAGQRVTIEGVTHVVMRTADGLELVLLDGPQTQDSRITGDGVFVWGEPFGDITATFNVKPPDDENYLDISACTQYDLPAWQYIEWQAVSADEAAGFASAVYRPSVDSWVVPYIVPIPPRAAWLVGITPLASVNVPQACYVPSTMYTHPSWGDGSDPSHYSIYPYAVDPVAVPFDNSACYIPHPSITPGTVVYGSWRGASSPATVTLHLRPAHPPWAVPVGGTGDTLIYPA